MNASPILLGNSFTNLIWKYNMTGLLAISVPPALESGKQLHRFQIDPKFSLPAFIPPHSLNQDTCLEGQFGFIQGFFTSAGAKTTPDQALRNSRITRPLCLGNRRGG